VMMASLPLAPVRELISVHAMAPTSSARASPSSPDTCLRAVRSLLAPTAEKGEDTGLSDQLRTLTRSSVVRKRVRTQDERDHRLVLWQHAAYILNPALDVHPRFSDGDVVDHQHPARPSVVLSCDAAVTLLPLKVPH
jgi:hypothetical protein